MYVALHCIVGTINSTSAYTGDWVGTSKYHENDWGNDCKKVSGTSKYHSAVLHEIGHKWLKTRYFVFGLDWTR